jgi:hypothetical protein
MRWHKILVEIEGTINAKEKNKLCANAICELMSELSTIQRKKLLEIENRISDYNIYIQDEIFKRLL